MFFGGDRRGFVRISDGRIAARRVRQDFPRWNCCEGVVNWKVEIIYFFTHVFVIRWQNETCNFFVFQRVNWRMSLTKDLWMWRSFLKLSEGRSDYWNKAVWNFSRSLKKFVASIPWKNVLPSLLPVMSRTGKIGCLKTKLP